MQVVWVVIAGSERGYRKSQVPVLSGIICGKHVIGSECLGIQVISRVKGLINMISLAKRKNGGGRGRDK